VKLNFLTLLAFGLLACNNDSETKSMENETTKDSFVHTDITSIENKTNKSNDSDCNFDKFLNDPEIPKLAKDLFNNTAKNPVDNEPLMYFEKFSSKDKQEREFYFKAVTNSYKVADGAYSEGLGYSGKAYIENNPKAFAMFFDNKICLTEIDLETWSDILILEFAIENEGERYNLIIDQFINKLKSKCKNCSMTQTETINKFGLILNEKWQAYLKNIN